MRMLETGFGVVQGGGRQLAVVSGAEPENGS